MGLKAIPALAVLGALLTACVNPNAYAPADGTTVHITQRTADGLQEYLQKIGMTHPGAFAVPVSGDGFSYYYCGSNACRSTVGSYTQSAIKDCSSSGDHCYILANNATVRYKFEVIK